MYPRVDAQYDLGAFLRDVSRSMPHHFDVVPSSGAVGSIAHAITRRSHSTKLGHPADWKKFPIHSACFRKAGINIDRLLDHYLPRDGKIRKRFEYLRDLVFFNGRRNGGQLHPLPGASKCPTRRAYISQQHLDSVVADGNFARVSASDEQQHPTLGWVKVFTVVEEDKHRLRVINHTEDANSFIRDKLKYKCEINVGHISEYRAHVATPDRFGFVADAKCAFWQIRLPAEARAYNRFYGPDGNLYEATCASMGHVAVCELMQLIMLCACGVPGFTRFVDDTLRNAKCSVWVDGCFVTTPTRADSAAALARLEANCRDVNLVLKHKYAGADVESLTPAQCLDFIGVTWDLRAGTMRIADKTYNKIPAIIPASMKAGEAEKLCGRLLFASAVAQLPIVHFYFAMKIFKRNSHRLNTGAYDAEHVISINPLKEVQRWRDAIAKHTRPVFVRSAPNRATADLFTDATLTNWGAILVLSDGRLFVHGGKFDDGVEHPIHVREAEAVAFAFGHFGQLLQHLASSNALHAIVVHVDNTTVEHNLRRGTTKVDAMQPVIQRVLDDSLRLRINIEMRRIGSKENPSDATSREKDYDPELLRQALAKGLQQTHERWGGSAAKLFVSRSFCVSEEMKK